MDGPDEREQYLEELNRQAEAQPGYREFLDKSRSPSQRMEALTASAKPQSEEDLANTMDIVQDQEEDPELRASALRAIGREMGERDESIDLLLELLQDNTQPREVRLAALHVLQMLAFTSPLFMSKRPEYLSALRSMVDDPDAGMRQEAIGILALEKDEYVQRRLNEGLDDPSKALVNPAKAIQLLGQDVHTELFPRLREIVQNPPSQAAREEAVRLLAGDPESKGLLVDLLRNKEEALKIRSLSAVSLQALDPSEFNEQAKQIVTDDSENYRLRLTGLNGLTHIANQPSLMGDIQFEQRLEQLRKKSTSAQLRDAIDRYLNRIK
jgi:uncharacterized protein (UPF0147 family)